MKRFLLNAMALCLFAASAATPAQAQAQAQTPSAVVTGTVFQDDNANGRFDTGERPLARVAVTDGYSVVTTDKKGHYSLSADPKSRFIYVSVPAAYSPQTQFYLPRNGNENNNGNGPSFDFALVPTPNQPLRFAQMADNEESIYREWIDTFKQWVRNEPPAFVMVTGDICYQKGLRMHAREFNTAKVGARILYAIGNHDLVAYGDCGEALYESLFGPVWYSFDVADVHFVVLPMFAGDVKPSYTAPAVFAWLAQDLACLPKGKKVVFFSHDLLLQAVTTTASDGSTATVPYSRLAYGDATFDLSPYRVEAYIYGHRHIQYTQHFPPASAHLNDTSYITTYATACAHKGAIDHTPSLYRIFTIGPDGRLTSEDRFSAVNRHVEALSYRKDGQSFVHVNTYNTAAAVQEVTVNGTALTQTSPWGWDAPYAEGNDPRAEAFPVAQVRLSDGSLLHQHVLPQARLDWVLPLGGLCAMNPPVAAQGLLVVATHDNQLGPANRIQAVDPNNGTVVWRFRTGNSVKGHMAVSGNRLVAADVEGRAYCLDVKTGTLLWQTTPPARFSTSYQMGVVIDGQRVYLSNGTNGCALDLQTGKVLWNNAFRLTSIANVTQLVVVDSLLITGSQWSGRVALDTRTGEKVWGYVKENDMSYNDSAPTLYDGKLYFCSHTHITVLDPASGKVLQSVPCAPALHGSASRPYVSDSLIIAGSYDRGVCAYHRNTLTSAWHFRSHRSLLYTGAYSKDDQQTVEASPLVNEGVVYFGAGDGRFYAINEKTGTFLWSLSLGVPFLSQAVWLDGALYVADMSGNLYRIIPTPVPDQEMLQTYMGR